ncbi:MAG TPA: L-threonylcarbamoyladenylate synthase [Gemmatimonadales bacterium]|nr:L-threonylcarbamoyladenylate synthase [Gemmatimonadales bacterium]
MVPPTILPVDPAHPDPAAIARAAGVIRRGGLVAFPTETVYGLGADALDAAAVERIFQAKERPGYNPLIVHVPDAEAARALTRVWPEAATRLAERFWPGPLTLVLPKRPAVPDRVTAGLDSVALRVPAHPVALALLRAAERPIAAPSANRFTQLSPTTAQHVAKGLDGRVELILDGGPTTVGIESTVVDLTGPRPAVLRPGILGRDALAAVIGALDTPDVVRADEAPRRGPGMLDRHYSPRATVRLFDPGAGTPPLPPDAVSGALLLRAPDPGVDHPVVLPADPEGYARELYAALHRLDDLGCALVLVERPPDGPAWAGVRDRLERAARA